MTTSLFKRPPAAQPDDFDPHSGSWLERLLFNHRGWVLFLCLVVTLVLGWQATRLQLQASFDKTIPTHHPYVVNYLEHRSELTGLGNALRIVVANPRGEIYDKAYMETLRRFSDEVFLLPGVDRAKMKSLWTPDTRWIGVTEDGLDDGPVIPDGWDGAAASLQQLRINAQRAGEIGQLVALDQRSSVIYVPLLAQDAQGHSLDYGAFVHSLEKLRATYAAEGVEVHVTGFAQVIGDLIDGVKMVLFFFAAAVLIVTAMIYAYTRCVRSTLLVVAASLIAVVWQLGLLPWMGQGLDPYSILVPFLVFAIGMSHGAQKMNGIMQDIGRGMHRQTAARMTFRRLFLAGLTALLADAVGFAVLMVVQIEAIRELATAASVGVAVLIFTNLILLPIMLSYTGVSPAAAARSLRAEQGGALKRLWLGLTNLTRPRPAFVVVLLAVALGGFGFWLSTDLQIGDLDPGAPELRADSRYNRDIAYTREHYGASSDVLAVMVRTTEGHCSGYEPVNKVDALEWQLRQLPGVESTQSIALMSRRLLSGLNEANPKWYDLPRNQEMLNTIAVRLPRGLFNDRCDLLTLYVYLSDHKAATLERVVHHVEEFALANNTSNTRFVLAAGSAGIEAATNQVVHAAWRQMLWLVYGAVALLCFVTFRSWRAVIVAILPLMLTSILAEAIMVVMGMGVKVATLPVIALGVGIGVDYALYILSITLAALRSGASLKDAYHRALLFTGKVVTLTGLTLAVGVLTWVFSPIKFQADMGLLLAFMFVWNMVGALVLVPALAALLLRSDQAVQGTVADAEVIAASA
ncbi:efflux RND transporter permease subunit [Duganella sp. PWIR1]